MRHLSAVLPIAGVLVASSLSAQDRVTLIPGLAPIAEVSVRWSAGTTGHTVELRNFRPEADPAVHVLSPAGFEVGRAVASGSVLSFSTTAQQAGDYTIVVRSRSSSAVETADLWVDGRLLQAGVRFSAGTAIRITGLASGEEIVGIRPPNGAATHSVYLLSPAGDTIVARSGGSRSRLRPGNRSAVVALYASRGEPAGSLRVYRNDVATDTDADGLGDALESALGTCASSTSSVAGVECRDLADPRDTDGDGLWDGWEVLGYDASWRREDGATVRQHLPLPTWGADPRHKDIFVEVDFRRLNLADNQNQVMRKMSPMIARQLAAIYSDAATTDGPLRLLHAVSVDNPDRRPGISLHLDTGVEPETADDATIYGDWGGYTAVDAVQDAEGKWIPQTPSGAYPTAMSPARRGIFHYVLGYTTGGGSCGQGIACGFNFADVGNSAHEFGHTLGLNHNGPYGTHEPNCKPNYPSLMNYAYQGAGFQEFSDGRNIGVLNNHALLETGAVDPSKRELVRALRERFRYKVDSVTGSVDWNRDNEFAPAGTTVRAYANLRPGDGGGCEFTREGETATGMTSQRSPAIVRFRDHLWIFSVTMDGKLAYTYTAPPFTCPAVDDCPEPRFVNPAIRDLNPIDGIDAAVITVNNRRLILIVGIRPDGSLFETWMEESSGRFIWGATVSIAGSSPAAGEPSLAASIDGRSVVLAYRGRDNIVRYRYRSPAAFGPEQTVTVGGRPLVMSANASPAVAYTGLPTDAVVAGGERLLGAFVDSSGVLHLYAPDRLARRWSRIGIPYDAMTKVAGRPALAWVGPLPGGMLAGAGGAEGPDRASVDIAGAPDSVRAERLASVSAERAGHVAREERTTAARATALPTTIGRLYVVYVRYDTPVPNDPKPDPVRMAMSYVDAAGRLRIGLDSYFDNVWSFAFGIDLLQPGEIALRAAETYSIRSAFNQVTLRPHADGISDLPYRNYDDWKVLAWGTCAVLAAAQTAPLKTKCAERRW